MLWSCQMGAVVLMKMLVFLKLLVFTCAKVETCCGFHVKLLVFLWIR